MHLLRSLTAVLFASISLLAQGRLRILDIGDSHLACRTAQTLGPEVSEALGVSVAYYPSGSIGACMREFTAGLRSGNGRYSAESIIRFAPQVILLSFGTNEANQYTQPTQMAKDVSACFEALSSNFPGARIILIGPPDGRLPHLDEVITGLYSASDALGVPLIDRRAAMGGAGSFARWQRAGYARPDGVHLSEKGYRLLNNAIASALAKAISN